MIDTTFLALSVSGAAEDVIATIRGGARGHVTKTISPDDLVDAIRRVHAGDAVFSPRLAGFVLDAFAGALPEGMDAADPEMDQLTAREKEVMRHIARGFTYRETAGRLHISIKTVETHVSAPQAAAVEPPRADRVGRRPPAAVSRRMTRGDQTPPPYALRARWCRSSRHGATAMVEHLSSFFRGRPDRA